MPGGADAPFGHSDAGFERRLVFERCVSFETRSWPGFFLSEYAKPNAVRHVGSAIYSFLRLLRRSCRDGRREVSPSLKSSSCREKRPAKVSLPQLRSSSSRKFVPAARSCRAYSRCIWVSFDPIAVTNNVPSPEFDLARQMREHEARLLADLLRTSRLTVLSGETAGVRTGLLTGEVIPLLQRRARDVPDGTAREIRVVIPFPDRRGRAFGRASQRAAELVVYFDVWSASPLDALRTSINAATPADAFTGAPDARLADALTAVGRHLDVQILIVLDRFDEFLNGALNASAVEQFTDEVSEAINRTDLRANFLLSLTDEAAPRLDGLRRRIPGFDDFSLRLRRGQSQDDRAPHRDSAVPQQPVPSLKGLASESISMLAYQRSTLSVADQSQYHRNASKVNVKAARAAVSTPRVPIRTEEVYAFIELSLAEIARPTHCDPEEAIQPVDMASAEPQMISPEESRNSHSAAISPHVRASDTSPARILSAPQPTPPTLSSADKPSPNTLSAGLVVVLAWIGRQVRLKR